MDERDGREDQTAAVAGEARSADPGVVEPIEDERAGAISGAQPGAGVFPVTAPRDVTPLEDDEQGGAIPPAVLWALKDHRHEQLPHPFGHPSRRRAMLGAGDAAVYAIDDGGRHYMIGRPVGTTGDGCTYTLLGRIPRAVYDQLSSGALDGRRAFMEAKDVALVGTGEEPGLANVFDVAFYRHPDDVPAEYLPPSPAIDFAEDLPTADR